MHTALNGTVIGALLLTAAAGLATTIGSLISIFYRNPGPRFMAFTMGFSAGVMVYVSYVELLQKGIQSVGFAGAHIALFAGMLVMFAIDWFLPHTYILESKPHAGGQGEKLRKASVLVALGVGIHNFPEGMATLASAMQDARLGAAIAFAIAIHNIPEGIAVAVPVYAATGSARKAFLWSFLSGVSEPLGALIAALILLPFLNGAVLGWMLCIVAGFMIFISFDELMPIAHSYSSEHLAIAGVTAGMIVMALSLLLFIA